MSLFDFFRRPKEPGKLFKKGQEVTRKSPGEWVCHSKGYILSGSIEFGDVVTVDDYFDYRDGSWYLKFKQYHGFAFRESDFEPVMTTPELEDALGSLNKIVMVQE